MQIMCSTVLCYVNICEDNSGFSVVRHRAPQPWLLMCFGVTWSLDEPLSREKQMVSERRGRGDLLGPLFAAKWLELQLLYSDCITAGKKIHHFSIFAPVKLSDRKMWPWTEWI